MSRREDKVRFGFDWFTCESAQLRRVGRCGGCYGNLQHIVHLHPSPLNVNVPISSATTMNLNQVGMQDLIGASPDWGHFYSFVIFLFFNPDNPVYN